MMKSEEVIALQALIENASNALCQLTKTAQSIDEAIGDMLSADQSAGKHINTFQQADLMRQSTECLAVMMKNLADCRLPEQEVPVANLTKGVFLESIRRCCSQA